MRVYYLGQSKHLFSQHPDWSFIDGGVCVSIHKNKSTGVFQHFKVKIVIFRRSVNLDQQNGVGLDNWST